MHTDEIFGRRFRDAWIAGVKKYFPGEPKHGYIAPWEEMAEWEKNAAIAVYKRAKTFIQDGPKLPSREQGGRYISEAWNVEVFRNIERPKPNYVTNWDELPEWQQQTDMDIYTIIEEFTLAG